MSYQLIIAEKPSVARSIAGVIVIACGVGFFLFEFQEVEGCAAAQQHHHKEHHRQ